MAKTLTRTKGRTLELTYTIQVWKENGTYVAYAPELDISTCGDSISQAKARLGEAVSLFLDEASRMGTLKDILAEAGFEKKGSTYRPPRVIVKEKIRLAIPVAS